MHGAPPKDMAAALAFATLGWRKIEAHVDEVFFGDIAGQAAVFSAPMNRFYVVEDASFGDQPVTRLVRTEIGTADIYEVLRSAAAREA